MEKLIDNWKERPPSERMILAALAVMMVCTLLYLLVFDPLISWREREQSRLKGNERKLVQVEGLVKRFEQQPAEGEQSAEGLASLIDASLRKNSLTMRGIQPGKNNDARLRLSNVPYESLTQWLYDLEYNHQISIEELNISQAKSQGLLMVNIRVKK